MLLGGCRTFFGGAVVTFERAVEHAVGVLQHFFLEGGCRSHLRGP